MHKRLVAGLSRLVTCLQSNFIGTNFTRFCSNLGVRGLFSSPFVSYWVHIDWLAPGYLMGVGNPTISRETETQVRAACQPRQPHRLPNYPRDKGLGGLCGGTSSLVWLGWAGRCNNANCNKFQGSKEPCELRLDAQTPSW